MLELYQFELSPYCEKVRLILDYKGLAYRKIEITPGVGQLEVFRISGQRKVPVLKDGETIVADSTEIAFYLDRKYPDNPLLPVDPASRGNCLLIEEWADASLGWKGRKAWLGALNQYQNFRTAFLPKSTPEVFKTLVSSVPTEFLDLLGTGVGLGRDALREAHQSLNQDLEALTLILQHRPYLVADTPTLADLAVAGLSVLLKFPAGSYLDIPTELKGKGIPGLADNRAYEPFFTWRDRLYTDYRRPLDTSDRPATGPAEIEIE